MLNTTTNGIVIRKNEIQHLNSCLDLDTIFRPVEVKHLSEYECVNLDGTSFPKDIEGAAKSLASHFKFRLGIALEMYQKGRVKPFCTPRNVGYDPFCCSIYPSGLRVNEYVCLGENLAPERASDFCSSDEYLLDVAAQMEETLYYRGVSKEKLWAMWLEYTSNSIKHCRILKETNGRLTIACGLSFFGLCGEQAEPMIATPAIRIDAR